MNRYDLYVGERKEVCRKRNIEVRLIDICFFGAEKPLVQVKCGNLVVEDYQQPYCILDKKPCSLRED